MHKILLIENDDYKSEICNTVLRLLPNWFGIEKSIVNYVNSVKGQVFWAAYIDDKPIGFLALKQHNNYSFEIEVMGILVEYHRQGIGKQLVEYAQKHVKENDGCYLTVKTLDESRVDVYYDGTRKFYISQGFISLEVFTTLWDETNPCLFMVKYLKGV